MTNEINREISFLSSETIRIPKRNHKNARSLIVKKPEIEKIAKRYIGKIKTKDYEFQQSKHFYRTPNCLNLHKKPILTDMVGVHIVRVFGKGETKHRFKANNIPILNDLLKKIFLFSNLQTTNYITVQILRQKKTG